MSLGSSQPGSSCADPGGASRREVLELGRCRMGPHLPIAHVVASLRVLRARKLVLPPADQRVLGQDELRHGAPALRVQVCVHPTQPQHHLRPPSLPLVHPTSDALLRHPNRTLIHPAPMYRTLIHPAPYISLVTIAAGCIKHRRWRLEASCLAQHPQEYYFLCQQLAGALKHPLPDGPFPPFHSAQNRVGRQQVRHTM